jgi:uncharacterized protein
MILDVAITASFLVLFVVCAATALYARWKGLVVLGFGVRDHPHREVLSGVVIGSIGMLGTVAVILATGGARVTSVGLDFPLLAVGLLVFVGAALLEETLYRALLLTGLARLTRSPLLALAVTSVVFGLVHVTGSPDATMISVLSNAMGGLMYGIAFLRTGRIWLALGIHFAWNFVQASLCGFATSDNTTFSGAVAHVAVSSTTWLSGGRYGPEGSVVSLLFRLVVIALVLAVTRMSAGSLRPRPGSGVRIVRP